MSKILFVTIILAIVAVTADFLLKKNLTAVTVIHVVNLGFCCIALAPYIWTAFYNDKNLFSLTDTRLLIFAGTFLLLHSVVGLVRMFSRI
jgi:hypothetical protein